jgi:signal transduction histidine kinase
MKIRNKLTYLFALIVASILLIFSLIIYYLSADYTRNEFYGRLEEKAYNTASLLFELNKIDITLLRKIEENNLTTFHDEEMVIFNYKDKVVYESGERTIPITKNTLDRVRLNGQLHYTYENRQVTGVLHNDKYNRFVVIISAVDRYGLSKLRNLAIILASGWLVSVIIVLVSGWFFADRALSPMASVVQQVEKITISNLNSRVKTGNNKDEIAQLAITFNKMLANLEEAFKIQKSFVSNASHELRTPLTAISGQIEVTLLQERSKEEYKAILNSIFDDIRSLTKLSNGLLELAQTSLDLSLVRFEAIRVDELLWQARSELIKKQPSYTVNIDFEELPEDENYLEVTGNMQWLKSAFLNLMENGCKFSNDKHVQVTIGFKEQEMQVNFSNKGIGIAPEDMPHIFEPFFRAENVKSISGHGIGLSLTEKVISLHKGKIHIDSTPNVGATFSVILPY